MIAVFVNMGTVLAGSLIGILFRNKIKARFTDALLAALALVTLSLGIADAISTADVICLIVCLVLGTAVGTLLKIETRLDSLGSLIKKKLPQNDRMGRFTEGFVSACLLFCVGSMTITGSFEAGIHQNYDIIFAKSALDFVSSMMFGAALGIGVPFSVFFILLFQGGLTLLAGWIAPYLSDTVITEMSAVGGIMLMGMGINMLGLSQKKIPVANMLPAIFLPIGYVPVYDLIRNLL